MNLKTTKHSPPRTLLLALLLGAGYSTHAGFQYTARDLVIGFRQDFGTAELAINAGQISTFYSLSPGSTITISNLTPTLVTNAFADLNNVHWSAAADVRTLGDPTYPIQTLWVISPRSDVNTQTSPWTRYSQYLQAPTASKIDGIANGAVAYGGQVPNSSLNTSKGIMLPAGDTTFSYSQFIGTGNYRNTFQGIAEVYTGPTFTDDGLPSRGDLYQLTPGTGSGTYLGYFELTTNGVLTFTAGAANVVIPQPTITAITTAGGTNTVTFTTISGANYSLRFTNSPGLTSPMSSWPVSGSPVAGDGSNKSLKDITGDPLRFYGVSASP